MIILKKFLDLSTTIRYEITGSNIFKDARDKAEKLSQSLDIDEPEVKNFFK